MTLAHFFEALAGSGVGQVVITNGAEGAYVGDGERVIYCPVVEREIAGTAGAGDAFASTFSVLFAETGDVRLALQAAAINAASVIAHVDTQTGLLRRGDLERELSEAAIPLQTWTVVGA
jgi:sugar/nucleoside kinase (ribokinase family)